MPIRRYKKDPRTAAQRHADERVSGLVESGDFLRVTASTERMAVEAVSRGQEERQHQQEERQHQTVGIVPPSRT
jgi:hypothetical protein